MKKLIALLLVLTMAVSLVACGGAEEKPAETEAPAAEGEFLQQNRYIEYYRKSVYRL